MARSRTRSIVRRKTSPAVVPAGDDVASESDAAVAVDGVGESASSESIGSIVRSIETDLRVGAALANCTIADGEVVDNEDDHVGEIDLDPRDDSLTKDAMDTSDDANGTVISISSSEDKAGVDTTNDSAVGTDERTDSSFQSTHTSDDGAEHSVVEGDEDAPAATTAANVSVGVTANGLHECVTLISDAVHLQTSSTAGVVDTKVVST